MDTLADIRRYGRIMVGSTHWGDHLVIRALEDLMDDDGHQPEAGDDVLQAMSRLWNGWFGEHMRASVMHEADRYPESVRMAAPAGFDRQVSLLTDFKQLTDEQTAKILHAPCELIANARQHYRDANRTAPKVVLIIEDDCVVAEAIKDQIESMGHRCCCIAPTASDAIECAFSILPGLIISDIKLADGSSGLDATRRIHKRIPVPTIYLTAYPELALMDEGEEPEFVLQKPYDPRQLEALVRHVLHWTPADLLAKA